MMAPVDVRQFLSRSPLFSDAAPESLRPLAARSRARVYRQGERVAANHDVWLVVHGIVKISYGAHGGAASSLADPGQVFGCLDPSCRKRHAVEAWALETSELIVVPREAFERLATTEPLVMKAVAHALSEKLWEERELRSLMHMPSSERMLAAVLALYRRLGARIPMTRAAIAELTGLARETSIRSLSPLEKRGLIRTRRGVIEVLKPSELQELLDRRLSAR